MESRARQDGPGGETPACLEMPSSQGTQTKRGGCLRRPERADARSGKTAPGPDAESRSDAALPPIPGDAPPSSGRGPTPCPRFSGPPGTRSAGRAVREFGSRNTGKKMKLELALQRFHFLKKQPSKLPAPIKNVPESKMPDNKCS